MDEQQTKITADCILRLAIETESELDKLIEDREHNILPSEVEVIRAMILRIQQLAESI